MAQCSQLSTWLVTIEIVTYWHIGCLCLLLTDLAPSNLAVVTSTLVIACPCYWSHEYYTTYQCGHFVSWDHRQWYIWPGKEIGHSQENWSLYLLNYWSSFLSDEQYMGHKYLYNFAHFKRFIHGQISTDNLSSLSSYFDWRAIMFYGVSFRTISIKN